jgi:hypothetical protein
MDRELRIVIVADTNSAEARAVLDSLADHPEIPQTVVTPKLVERIIPVRANPAIGVMLWSNDLQGMVADVEAFAAYIKGEAEIKAAAHTAQRYVPDEVAFAQPRILFESWSGDGEDYVAGDIRMHGGDIYRCISGHTSQPDWAPDVAVSLWVRIADPAEEWPEWIQPVGGHDAYGIGAQVSHNGKHWASDVDGNVWEPGVYGWTEV